MRTQNFAAEKIELTELANKLFMYTDAREWQKLLDEVFTENVWFDMSSAGSGVAQFLPAKEICHMWQKGFEDLDAVHHQAGHYLISIMGENANIYAYAVATHYKQNATNGKTRTFFGSYDLEAKSTAKGWRLSKFKYNLKYIDGNAMLV